jgi:ABC-type Mn2+/Zn2+ transport system permease subunit
MLKIVEFVGVLCGIIGSFLVANGMMMIGYPVFLTSSACLLFSAFKQGNKNLMLLQFVFLCANINGLINFS